MSMSSLQTDPIEQVVEAFAAGQMVALMDDPDRECEADLILAAQFATGEKLNVMATVARGLFCAAVTGERLEELDIPMIQPVNCGENWPHFAEPVDYKIGTTTGASAFDLAATARALADPQACPEDFTRPGHMQVLREHHAGLAGRAGHTEGAMGLARLAKLYPAVIICEMMAPDGRMASGKTLESLVRENRFPLTSVKDIARSITPDA
jgi:3,4-dihydroxy-2-butanone 4-phosphate synthase